MPLIWGPLFRKYNFISNKISPSVVVKGDVLGFPALTSVSDREDIEIDPYQ